MASSTWVLGLTMGVLVRAAMNGGAFAECSTEDADEQEEANHHINERSNQDDQEDHTNGIIQTVNKEGGGEEKSTEDPSKDRNSDGACAEGEDKEIKSKYSKYKSRRIPPLVAVPMHAEVKHRIFHAALCSKCSVVHVVRHGECYERIKLLAKNDRRILKEYLHTYPYSV
jgi:hypothetical protein